MVTLPIPAHFKDTEELNDEQWLACENPEKPFEYLKTCVHAYECEACILAIEAGVERGEIDPTQAMRVIAAGRNYEGE